MGSAQSVLAQLWLYAFLLGVGLGAVYDALRITRVFLGVSYVKTAKERLQSIQLPLLSPQRKRHTSRVLGVVIFLEDFLFALTCGVSMILLIYQVNNGKIRAFAYVCAACGFFLYRATLGRLVITLAEYIAFAIEAGLRYFFFFAFLPIRMLFKSLQRIVSSLWKRRVEKRDRKNREKHTKRETDKISNGVCELIPLNVGGEY